MGKVDLDKETIERIDALQQADGSAAADALTQRQRELPPGHPSEPGYGRDLASGTTDAREPERAKHDGAEGTQPERRITALTDAEHAEHVAEVRDLLDDARAAGLATDRPPHCIDAERGIWSEERAMQQDEIVSHFYAAAASVPDDGQAILAGGLPGAGKTTVLSEYAGIDLSQYLRIDPDRIKEEMAARNMIPAIEGLSPMEASDLVHVESAHIAKQLALRAYADRKNVIWDVSMSSTHSTNARIDHLRDAGYGRIEAIFVDIPIEVSKSRADARHRDGHESYRAGDGYGGRYLPPAVIDAQADLEWGSKNRAVFEAVKSRLDAWYRYDNSADHQPPNLVASSNEDTDQSRSASE